MQAIGHVPYKIYYHQIFINERFCTLLFVVVHWRDFKNQVFFGGATKVGISIMLHVPLLVLECDYVSDQSIERLHEIILAPDKHSANCRLW